MIATKDRVRIVETRVLSDDWYLLKKPPLIFCGATASGSGRAARLTIAVMAPPFCCSTGRRRR